MIKYFLSTPPGDFTADIEHIELMEHKEWKSLCTYAHCDGAVLRLQTKMWRFVLNVYVKSQPIMNYYSKSDIMLYCDCVLGVIHLLYTHGGNEGSSG